MCLISDRLLEKTYMFEKKGIQVSKVRSVSEPLRLGRLAGNRFDLVIRDLKPHRCSSVDLESLVKEAVENVKVNLIILNPSSCKKECFIFSVFKYYIYCRLGAL